MNAIRRSISTSSVSLSRGIGEGVEEDSSMEIDDGVGFGWRFPVSVRGWKKKMKYSFNGKRLNECKNDQVLLWMTMSNVKSRLKSISMNINVAECQC